MSPTMALIVFTIRPNEVFECPNLAKRCLVPLSLLERYYAQSQPSIVNAKTRLPLTFAFVLFASALLPIVNALLPFI